MHRGPSLRSSAMSPSTCSGNASAMAAANMSPAMPPTGSRWMRAMRAKAEMDDVAAAGGTREQREEARSRAEQDALDPRD